MLCWVYILKCNDGSYYTGITSNLERRLFEHKKGIRSWLTKSKKPFKLVYKEQFKARKLAAKREREIKGWSRKKKSLLINKFKNKA